MTVGEPYRIIAEEATDLHRVQLVEDEKGVYYFRKTSIDGNAILKSVPVYHDARVLAEAREFFPDFLPFSAVPVDAT